MVKIRFLGLMPRAAIMTALASLLLSVSCAGHASDASQTKIGAPPGASLLLADYVATEMGTMNGTTPILDVNTFPDCCSANIQLALSSLSIDAALMCPDSAEALIEKDNRFFIVGPCLANSDVLVIHGDSSSAVKIGVSQNHLYQTGIVNTLLGPGLQIEPMLYSALSSAYEKGDVDGVVIDIEGALLLQGPMLSTGGNKADVVTYDLVALKNLPGLDKLKDAFITAAAALSDPVKLQAALAAYDPPPVNGQEANQWAQENVRFLSPEQG